MADQEQSTRPVALALRESFIAYFQLPGQEAVLRAIDELAYQAICEVRGDYLMPKEHEPGTPDPITRTDVLAAAGDLRQAADQLKESAQALAEIGSEEREVMRIALAIADTSAAVQTLADALDAALTRFLAAPPASRRRRGRTWRRSDRDRQGKGFNDDWQHRAIRSPGSPR